MPHKKQGNIMVDAARELSVPMDAHAALERSHMLDNRVQNAQRMRHEEHSAHKAEQPSTNPLPALHGLKNASHVHHVFKKP